MTAGSERSDTKVRGSSPPPAGSLRLTAFLILVLLLLSCTGEPPEIVQVYWQLNLVEQREQDLTYQSLSLFIKPNDPDGFEDIEDVFLINDEQELFWRLDGESWVQSGSEQETWIGSNSLKMPDGASFPEGEYRILLRDVGGDSAEQTIRLNPVSSKEARRYLPQVTVDGGRIKVTGQAPEYQLWVYDANGRYLAAFSVSRDPLSLETIYKSQPPLREGFSFKVYGLVENRNLGVMSGHYYVKP